AFIIQASTTLCHKCLGRMSNRGGKQSAPVQKRGVTTSLTAFGLVDAATRNNLIPLQPSAF
ncbi:MAG: hypothetical protein ACRD22_11420, partial [Terriglobia bacterium]